MGTRRWCGVPQSSRRGVHSMVVNVVPGGTEADLDRWMRRYVAALIEADRLATGERELLQDEQVAPREES